MGYRLIDRASVDRIKLMLQRGYAEAQEKLKTIEWRELPDRRESKVYAIDGSQGKQRLSGTIFYAVSSYAFGNGPAYRLVYTNAMLYNQGISDQIIRLQMETLENKLGYLAAKIGNVDYVMMDGTLTGSLTRPPVYPESVRGINALQVVLEDEFASMIEFVLERLEKNYQDLESRLKKEGKSHEEVIFAESLMRDVFRKFFRNKLIAHSKGIRIRNCETAPEKVLIPLDALERYRGRSVEEAVENLRKKYCREIVIEDIREAIHVVLSYIEYLYSLEQLLDMNLIYVAKSFYTKRFSKKAGVDLPDVPYLDAYIRKKFGEEIPGYLPFPEPVKVEHSLPESLREFFPKIEDMSSRGVPSAYIRTMKGGVIYLLQSNREINDDLLAEILWHERNGYFRPLQRAHEGVKIEKKAFDAELKALLNIIKAESPELRVFLKYGRSPLE
ncbi:DNA double-strand break repair nuclease NurA [Thermococcus thioreducens]|uniref:5'-3' exonuclease n=1 Tax=Thermococcus thioreducens TaxID=277988 RepID=A0A0Q2MUC5_9EURY|nr:DNA double-strand break repair nuclease NurA [Thermococcus thioreducens]ASJ13233.1 5'-3' exonuclease [Thermococcus thioreducens]KQH83351.1 5'-3' exonuclease [Thermococcus thioreducens]SEW21286.1 NurA 5'-3' nuclease [Thermococcus thioreducens]